jgi:uncharacterized membrane protein
MQLLILLLLLVVPFLVLTLLGWVNPKFRTASTTRARVGLSCFFVFTAIGHFIRTEEMSAMLPPIVPYRRGIIYLTGALELLGAIGIWVAPLMRLTGICLILMLIGIFPANIYSALNHVAFGGHGSGPVYLLVRVPFQLFVLWWTYWATEQKWFTKNTAKA